jgi:hypothetical protein
MRVFLETVVTWSLAIFFSMIMAIPIAVAFIWMVLLLVRAVHDGR